MKGDVAVSRQHACPPHAASLRADLVSFPGDMVVIHFPSTLGETRGMGKKEKTYAQQLGLAL